MYGKPEEFTVTQEHVKLLRHAYVDWDDGEFGAPAINCKRPYGNSSVPEDIAEILGWDLFEDEHGERHLSKEQGRRARDLHKGTKTALQVFLCTGEMKPGLYRQAQQYDSRSWELVGQEVEA